LSNIAERWGLAPGDHLLSGDTAQVNAALDAWGVGRARDDATGDVEHAVVVILVERGGRRAIRLDGSWHRLKDLLPNA
jgi:3-deoxy-D-manno-octulosonate 8-phosphate phosphatase KdsC-like HAD superfamily phosphatase